MKKVTEKIYKLISSAALSAAVLSLAELNTFCILIIHQPDIPKCLREKAGLMPEEENESIDV